MFANSNKNGSHSLLGLVFKVILVLNFCRIGRAGAGCPGLIQRMGVKVKCWNPKSEEIVNCYQKELPVGTEVTYVCDNFYTAIEGFEESPARNLTCNENSKWMGLGQFYTYSCQLECGATPGLENEKFVIGGSSTTAERWPWHSTIFIARDKEFTYQCGGTLVNGFGEGFVILTAAHCLLDEFDKPYNPNQLRVVLGGQRSDLMANKNDFNAQLFSVQKVICHEDYIGERELHQNDIGILKLQGLIHLTNTVIPVCLSASNDLASQQLKVGSMGEVVGFGRFTNELGKIVEPSPTLRQAKLPVVHDDGCYQWQKYHLDQSQICAGYLNELSVCKGDSGGGYVFRKETAGVTRYYLQGIVSYGYVRNETFCENYGVFTKIHHHTKWIRKQMEGLAAFNHFQAESEEDVVIEKEFSLTKLCPVCPAALAKTSCPVQVCPTLSMPIPSPNAGCPTTTSPTTISSPSPSPTPSPQPQPPIEIEIEHEILIHTQNPNSAAPRPNSPNPPIDSIEEISKIIFPNYHLPTATSEFPFNEVTLKNLQNSEAGGPVRFYSFELGGQTDYQTLALNLHNNYRSQHGAPPLRLSDKLSREALAYAHKLIQENTFVNVYPQGESPPSYNKNIFQIMESGVKNPTSALEVVRQAVNYWYSEINKYNWNIPGTTTFSQVVWRATTDLGVGVAIGHQGNTFRQVVVAAYSPPGNIHGSQYFRTNVIPKRHK